MTNAKKISAVFLVVIVITLFAYHFWNTNSAATPPEPMTVAENTQNTSTTEVNNSTAPLVNMAELDSKPYLETGKKHYDDDWCMPDQELSESDLMYAQSELENWFEALGMAKIGVDKTSSFLTDLNPNHVYVAPYESLPIDELQTLALEGDKWAMIAFVQDTRADINIQEKVAKQLLVHGASYYALDFLTMKSLSSAAFKRDIGHPEQEVNNLIVDAFAYLYWGLSTYNEGGLDTYLEMVSKNPLVTSLPFDKIFPVIDEQVNQRIEQLNDWVLQERAAKGIVAPEPPAAIKKLTAHSIAAKERLYKEQMNQLRQLNVSAAEKIQVTPCIEKILARIAETSKK